MNFTDHCTKHDVSFDARIECCSMCLRESGRAERWRSEYQKLERFYTREGMQTLMAKYWPDVRIIDADTAELCAQAHPLSRRDEFAKAAMQTILTETLEGKFTPFDPSYSGPKKEWETLRPAIASVAIEMADALIAELDKTP